MTSPGLPSTIDQVREGAADSSSTAVPVSTAGSSVVTAASSVVVRSSAGGSVPQWLAGIVSTTQGPVPGVPGPVGVYESADGYRVTYTPALEQLMQAGTVWLDPGLVAAVYKLLVEFSSPGVPTSHLSALASLYHRAPFQVTALREFLSSLSVAGVLEGAWPAVVVRMRPGMEAGVVFFTLAFPPGYTGEPGPRPGSLFQHLDSKADSEFWRTVYKHHTCQICTLTGLIGPMPPVADFPVRRVPDPVADRVVSEDGEPDGECIPSESPNTSSSGYVQFRAGLVSGSVSSGTGSPPIQDIVTLWDTDSSVEVLPVGGPLVSTPLPDRPPRVKRPLRAMYGSTGTESQEDGTDSDFTGGSSAWIEECGKRGRTEPLQAGIKEPTSGSELSG